ncbi:ABC-type multidrug transport system, ATPase and permease component [Mycolicibacterium rhodesiae NBB3]|uniref:ABC-type multidrug transport system, ATPase and permease component n=1 Tax=Mycolicibacterium rhodesiae (strain NBB3) TaxID=710685 RepID=G8RHV3_MYCRN|nr:ABC transporter ATP-binding protein [Mycolicibacterium rhodesiae]AEV72103.1 ABC-type multidrug transport system, ATPase and permease component [Mycolicibacterium rhodesiae NBB3]
MTQDRISTRAYIRRSLPMLGKVRGQVALSIVLGLVVSALPFVANAAFGPVMQAIADAGMAGNLAGVWKESGALLSRTDGAGPLNWLTTPQPFAVLLGIWAAALLAAQVLGFAKSWIDAQVEWRLLTVIRRRVHDHIQSLSLDFFSGARVGALMQRVQLEAAGVQRLLTMCVIPPLVDAVVLLAALAYLIALSWQMTVVSLVLAPLVFAALRFTGRKLQAATQRMMVAHRWLGGELEETVSGISEVQVFNAQGRRSERFHEASLAAAKSIAAMTIWTSAATTSAQVLIAIATVLVLIVGVVFGASFGLTFAGLVVFVGFIPAMFAAVQRIAGAYSASRSILPNVVSTYELLDTEPAVRERPDALALGDVHGNISFEDVVYSYTPEHKVLDGLSFTIREGETVALVGPIGCGKSTVFNLMLRFLEPQRGRIVLDGHDIGAVTISSLREQVSKLAQFPFFAKDTIRENVRMARTDACDADVEEACRLAQVHSVIVDPARVHRGYDTVMDVQVPSGGQKRLIALARCLLRKPEVLLLDEPTENLDADQRVRLTRVIREYACERTCIVISHDMDFIASVSDRIIVLDGGRAAEQGTHETLLARNGVYRKLYEAQNVDPGFVRKPANPGSAAEDDIGGDGGSIGADRVGGG